MGRLDIGVWSRRGDLWVTLCFVGCFVAKVLRHVISLSTVLPSMPCCETECKRDSPKTPRKWLNRRKATRQVPSVEIAFSPSRPTDSARRSLRVWAGGSRCRLRSWTEWARYIKRGEDGRNAPCLAVENDKSRSRERGPVQKMRPGRSPCAGCVRGAAVRRVGSGWGGKGHSWSC